MGSSDLSLVPSIMLILLLSSHPQGIINLGTSENKLCFDLLSRRVSPGGYHELCHHPLEAALLECCLCEGL